MKIGSPYPAAAASPFILQIDEMSV